METHTERERFLKKRLKKFEKNFTDLYEHRPTAEDVKKHPKICTNLSNWCATG